MQGGKEEVPKGEKGVLGGKAGLPKARKEFYGGKVNVSGDKEGILESKIVFFLEV